MKNFEQLELLIGREGLLRLSESRVLVFGIGGVGGFVLEALVRSGVGHLTIVDGDVVEESNLNRQIIATEDAIGKFKVDVAKKRCLEINSEVEIEALKFFYGEDSRSLIKFADFDYVVDCVDDMDAKIMIVKKAFDLNVNMISAMSAGNKICSWGLKVSDLFETSVCPIARIMRARLKKLGIDRLKVVYSTEKPKRLRRCDCGSVASAVFVPASMGIIMANVVVGEILGFNLG